MGNAGRTRYRALLHAKSLEGVFREFAIVDARPTAAHRVLESSCFRGMLLLCFGVLLLCRLGSAVVVVACLAVHDV